jgi:thymidylate synthase
MLTYLHELQNILINGDDHEDRTGVGRRSVYGRQFRFSLANGFPLVTTKKVSIKNIIIETLWFLSGSQRALDLEEQGVNIWKQWTPTMEDAEVFYEQLLNDDRKVQDVYGRRDIDDDTIHKLKKGIFSRIGTIGPLYGSVWRGKYETGSYTAPDQIKNLITNLKERPFHSRHCVTAWIPSLLPNPKFTPKENVLLGLGALAPCHFFFQCFVKEPKDAGGKLRLSMNVNLRSLDFPIGTPYNVAQYALLLMMIAQVTGMDADELIVTGGDCHIYFDQLTLVPVQLARDPKKLPELLIDPSVKDIDDFKLSDFELVGYEHHDFIKYPVAT